MLIRNERPALDQIHSERQPNRGGSAADRGGVKGEGEVEGEGGGILISSSHPHQNQ